MKFKQKKSQKKYVHMSIQPVSQNMDKWERRGSDKVLKRHSESKIPYLNSPDALFPQNDTDLGQDQIIEEGHIKCAVKGNTIKKVDFIEQYQNVIKENTAKNIDFIDQYQNSLKQSQIQEQNARISKSNIQKEQEQRERITQSYLYDHYQLILRPIAKQLIQSSILFILTFVVIKVFWIYEDITLRKQLEEIHLKTIMQVRLTQVRTQYQHSFALLNAINLIYSHDLSLSALNAKNQTNCSSFAHRYVCNDFSTNNNSLQFYKQIDINYDMLSSQVAVLLQYVNASNLFILNTQKGSLVQFNLSKIINDQLGGDQGILEKYLRNSLDTDEVSLLAQFMSNNQYSQSQDQMVTYLDQMNQEGQQFQWWEVYLYDQNVTDQNKQNYKQKFNIYCLFVSIKYVSPSNKAKACISIQTALKIQKSQNILFIRTQFPKIKIAGNSLANINSQQDQIEQLYGRFRTFVQSEVSSVYYQYRLQKEHLIYCLNFHDSFHQKFSSEFLSLQIFRCFYSQYLHLLTSQYIFSWSMLKINRISFSTAAFRIRNQQKFAVQSFIFSNNTFFSQVHQITKDGIQSIELICKVYGLILMITLLLFQNSKNIIKTKMLGSLFTLKMLAKLVKNIDEVKNSQNQFKKIIKQIKEKNQTKTTYILGVLINYLRKFLWIKKLHCYNKKFSSHKIKKNRLLFEGLDLFKYVNDQAEQQSQDNQKNGQFLASSKALKSYFPKDRQKFFHLLNNQKASSSNDQIIVMNYQKYPAVLIYIYQELIFLELDKIQNLKNVKVLSKKRQAAKKRTNSMHILHQIQDQNEKEDKVHYQKQSSDFHNNVFSINDQQMPQISIMDTKPRQNRGVRFSNQIQFKGFNQEQKKPKFRQNIHSNSLVGKKNSVKSIQGEHKKRNQESEKVSRSQEDSAIQSTSKKIRRQTTINNILMGEQSVHQGLKTMKFDQNSNIYEGQPNFNRNYSVQYSIDQDQVQASVDQFYYTHKQVFEQTIETYEKIVQHYEELIEIKERSLEKLIDKKLISFEQQQERINQIYNIEIRRLKMCYKYLKILLHESKGEQVDFDEKGINFDYGHLTFYEDNYQIRQQLLDKSTLYKMRISICLGKSISYKQLQQICSSQNVDTCLQSNFLYAQELSKLQPYLDFEVIKSCGNSLCSYQTTTSFKRKTLELMVKTLARINGQFAPQIQELQLIKRYYNRKHKKFYFIADMTESYDIFTPVLAKIYQLMGKMDLMQIYNLGMNQNLQDMELVRQIIKPQTIEAFIYLFEQLTLQSQKIKQKNSSKLIHKRLVCEKDFNEILDEIEKDETEFSSFLVIILGADQLSNHSSIMAEDVDSSNNQRQLNQLLYSEINRKIQRNYYHIIQLGTNLNNFMTKQGKLKKHIKNSFDLLEVDLAKKNIAEHFAELQKFIIG